MPEEEEEEAAVLLLLLLLLLAMEATVLEAEVAVAVEVAAQGPM